MIGQRRARRYGPSSAALPAWLQLGPLWSYRPIAPWVTTAAGPPVTITQDLDQISGAAPIAPIDTPPLLGAGSPDYFDMGSTPDARNIGGAVPWAASFGADSSWTYLLATQGGGNGYAWTLGGTFVSERHACTVSGGVIGLYFVGTDYPISAAPSGKWWFACRRDVGAGTVRAQCSGGGDTGVAVDLSSFVGTTVCFGSRLSGGSTSAFRREPIGWGFGYARALSDAELALAVADLVAYWGAAP